MKKQNDFLQILSFLSFIWAIFLLQVFGIIITTNYSVNPDNSIFSIITGVFLHQDYRHLVGNTSILLITLPLLFKLYPKSKYILIITGLLIPSVVCYLLGLVSIGISGLVFAVVWFVIFRGLKSKNLLKLAISIILAMLFSSTLIGITPAAGYNIAWQAHLAGFLVGLGLALFRSED